MLKIDLHVEHESKISLRLAKKILHLILEMARYLK